MKISDALKQAILKSTASRYRICKETGIDQGAMSRFLSGKTHMQSDSIDLLCEFLELELTVKKRKRHKK